MAAVASLTAEPEGFLLTPSHGSSVCADCFNLTRGFKRCYACSRGEQHLAAFAPVSYSIAHEQLHNALWSYKRLAGARAEDAALMLSKILWRFLAAHERCVADAAGVAAFDLVTTVPSGDLSRDRQHPLRRIAGELVGPTRGRHVRLLRRTEKDVIPRRFDANRYESVHALDGENVLLIDDTWTTGASAQSAAAALRKAGAEKVAAVVIGRHVNREWHENGLQLDRLPYPFDWSNCVLCQQNRLAIAA